jgi:hypothetical protein
MDRFRFSRAFLAGVPTLAMMLASAPYAALADDDDGGAPPDPGVARVSVLHGDVDVKRADSGDTVAAAVNAPLSAGDYLSTQDDSHAEVQFDYGTTLRVGSDTQLRFTQLDPKNHQLQLAAGTVDLRVFRGLKAGAQIQTPQATIQPDENGSTIVSVDNDGNAQVTVRSGSADVITQSATQTLAPGTTLAITGDANDAQMQTVADASYGSFDSWIASRDLAFARVADYRYVDADMVGAQDLYGNGTWVDNAQYGQVWVPTVPAGWAPYQDGRWVWEPYYGWTWVDREPWGWAPFHYGNWFYEAGTGWAWYPGAYAVAQPYVYRPALVAFFSFGGGSGLSIGFGNVGWVPIAPYEPFHPWWTGSGGYGYGRGGNLYNDTTIVNTTTIVNNYNITKIYRNAGAPGGATGVPSGNFQNGNFNNLRALQSSELVSAQPVHAVVPIVPSAHNLTFGGRGVVAPIAPIPRFAAFHAPVTHVVPTFATQQARVRESATLAYPTHAETFTRPLPVERPDAAVERPNAAYDTTPTRGSEPDRVRPASPTQNGDAFGRFNNGTTQPPSSAEPPATRPYNRTTPQYETPARITRPTAEYAPVSHTAKATTTHVHRPKPRPTPE